MVGLPDPVVLPSVSVTTSSGSLGAGTYYIKIAYYTGSTLTNVSPEATALLTGPGTIYVNPPVLQPASATGYKVYIGASSGTETLQGTVSGWTQFSQSVSLSAGAAMLGSNTSSCALVFSDQLIPTGTGYTVNLLNRNGNKIAGAGPTCTNSYGTHATPCPLVTTILTVTDGNHLVLNANASSTSASGSAVWGHDDTTAIRNAIDRARRIWLNLELAKKPSSCLEFIIVHEMIHLLERRHNEQFRNHMDRLLPHWRMSRALLNQLPLGQDQWKY